MDNCEIEYNSQRKEIRGGNKKKLISNLQKRKKNCEVIEINVWSSCSNLDLYLKLSNIQLSEIEDKHMTNLIRTLKQQNSNNYNSENQRIKNYVSQDLVFNLFKKLEIYSIYDEDFDYIKRMNQILEKRS